MFDLFKRDPFRVLQEQYIKIQKEAVSAQRNGNIELYSELSLKAYEVEQEMKQISLQLETGIHLDLSGPLISWVWSLRRT